MAYILDRDISVQARVAPIQLDSDIDLDLPPFELGDDLAGFIFTANGEASMNFFRARAQLARIQGKVYEYVFSISAQKATHDERASNISHIFHALDDWSDQVPLAFWPSALSQTSSSGLPRYLCMLYAVRLQCRALVSHGCLSDSFHYSRWVADVRDYGEIITAGQDVLSQAPMSQGWETLVDESRAYLELFATVMTKDAFLVS